MKNHSKTPSSATNHRSPRFTSLLAGMAATAALACLPATSQAQIQLLTDPGAESSTPTLGTFVGWTQWGGGGAFVADLANPGVAPYDGTNYFKIWGNYNNATDYSGFFQTFGAHPGEIFTAGGYVYQNPSDGFAAQNSDNRAYLEVQFKDINGNILADYQSGMYTNGWPQGQWISWPVTNEVSPNPGLVTTLVAPLNTVQVEYDVVFNLIGYGGGSIYVDDLSLQSFAPPPPYVTNLAPANVILATNQTFSFGAVAQSGNITNVQLSVTAISGIVNPTTNTYTYTAASTNVVLAGLGTPSVTGSFPISSNVTYTVTVLAIDSNAGTAVQVVNFDTIQPTYLFEAEDFNYNSGQFINAPANGGVNLYTNLVGTTGIDEYWFNNPSQSDLYRPSDAVSIGGAYETPRQKFLNAIADGSNTNALDYEVGYNNLNDWENYTRIFPAGTYNIYARMAVSGANNQVGLALVGGDPTSDTQTPTNLGYCNVSGDNWNQYFYCPLVDSFGNLVSVKLGGQQTIRSTVTAGGPNINFYMIVPASGSPYPGLISSYPTGAHPFEPTNKFSFTIGPAQGSAIISSAIGLTLNGVNVTPELTLSAGASNSWIGTVPISASTIYTAVISATNETSLHSSFTINFDTFSQQNFMWEAEDFDFNGGQFIDNPIPSYDPTIVGGGVLEPNSYCGFPEGNFANLAIVGVDDNCGANSGETYVYRPSDTVGTQVVSDYQRQKFAAAQVSLDDPNIADLDVGWFDGGYWINYSHTYPAGAFNVYGRLAGGGGPFSGTTLAQVTGGVGTTTQTTNVLGAFADPNAAGWQTWHWIELTTNGAPAVITLGGVETLQIESGGNVNMNYFMLVPAAAPAGKVTLSVSLNGKQPEISFLTTAGHTYTLVYTASLTAPSWIAVGQVTGNGSTQSLTDTTTAGVVQRFYAVQVQ